MPGNRISLIVVSACLLCGVAAADLVTARIDSRTRAPGKLTVTGSGDRPTWEVQVDLSGLPKGARIYRARLFAKRTEPLTGRENWALTNIYITPLVTVLGGKVAPLKLVGPWYDRFDATGVIKQHLKEPQICKGFSIEAFPKLDVRSIYLDIEYEGKLPNPPRQPTGLRVLHRAGQTFITWREMEKRIAEENVTWGVLKKAIEDMDAKGVVRYRVYRHTEPISARNIARAECLAEVKPLSCYNVEGRSLERLISMHRRRAIGDIAFSRKLARGNYFSRYNIHMPEMAEVVVDRFVIDDSGRPLPVGSGLYVHNPAVAGREVPAPRSSAAWSPAYYAVATCVNGVTNTVDLGAANATARPIGETVGPGEPVFQAAGTLKVFYDYPGQRRYYVQWTGGIRTQNAAFGASGRPLSNLPNQYYNWHVYIPPDPPKPTPIRVCFTKDQFMRPGTRHRRDTILISGRDGPVWSFWYGYHEALGTLRSFSQGAVQPYTKRRLFAFIDWAMKEFNGDPKRLSAVGGTDALYCGVRHGRKFAYVLSNQPDPNPQVTPGRVRIGNYIRRPPRAQREHVWGKVEWKIPGEKGRPIWDEFDLIACVREDPRRELAFLSMGPASLSAPWPRQVEFMKTLWQANQAFAARFYWGGGRYLPVPEGRVGARDAFDFALDIPMLALRNNSNDRGLKQEPFAKGRAQYWSGGRIADGRRWLADFVDEPNRFEMTIHGRGPVTYAGGGTSDVTPRRTKKFKPKPGDRLNWENVDLKTNKPVQSGQTIADEHGLVTIPQVRFGAPSRLKIYTAE